MRLTAGVVIYPPLDHPLWLLVAFVIGSCIGSFLNVVIYRVPLGLSVNDPKRSFCPGCKKEIPMKRNIPLVSWLALRGRCADCGSKIAFRYFAVELLTGLLFAGVWAVVIGSTGGDAFALEQLAVLPLWFMIAAFVAIAFIDAEHLIIPLSLTISGTVAGLLAALAMPGLPDLAGMVPREGRWWEGLVQAVAGGVIGFFGLWAVVLLGKLAFGRKAMKFDKAVAWHLEEPKSDNESIVFQMGEERIEWWDIFYRASDRLVIETETLVVNGGTREGGTLVIRETVIELPDGEEIELEKLKSLAGTAASAVVPREAMGMGDVHLMGMIGAFFGAFGVFFALFAASMFAIVAALLGRIGFGMRLPFGPFLVLGAVVWLFGGWKLGEWYLGLLR